MSGYGHSFDLMWCIFLFIVSAVVGVNAVWAKSLVYGPWKVTRHRDLHLTQNSRVLTETMPQPLLAVIFMRVSVRTGTEGTEPCFEVFTTPFVGFCFGSHSGCVVHKHTNLPMVYSCETSHSHAWVIKHGKFEERSSADGRPDSLKKGLQECYCTTVDNTGVSQRSSLNLKVWLVTKQSQFKTDDSVWPT